MLSLIVPVFNQGRFGTYTNLSKILSDPRVFLISPDKAEIKVDFPLAIPPTTPTNSPRRTAKEMSVKEVFRPPLFGERLTGILGLRAKLQLRKYKEYFLLYSSVSSLAPLALALLVVPLLVLLPLFGYNPSSVCRNLSVKSQDTYKILKKNWEIHTDTFN